jgi:hypothetical protein
MRRPKTVQLGLARPQHNVLYVTETHQPESRFRAHVAKRAQIPCGVSRRDACPVVFRSSKNQRERCVLMKQFRSFHTSDAPMLPAVGAWLAPQVRARSCKCHRPGAISAQKAGHLVDNGGCDEPRASCWWNRRRGRCPRNSRRCLFLAGASAANGSGSSL